MIKAQLVTIGTEILSGEVVNSNAAWVSLQLENLGVRVLSHLTVRDDAGEIAQALASSLACDIVVVTGGLGPTSDDITRQCLADHTGHRLEFDLQVWNQLKELYQQRDLPLREAHKHQCYFPQGSERLKNPVGTALGFALEWNGKDYFVLPGPPRELMAMWTAEVVPRLRTKVPAPTFQWRRWICLGAPESEVAELVEAVVASSGVELGYRANVPYVTVKLYVDPSRVEHQRLVSEMSRVLSPFLVGEGLHDLAAELLQLWPQPTLAVVDELSGGLVVQRLFQAQAGLAPSAGPRLSAQIGVGGAHPAANLILAHEDGGGVIHLQVNGHESQQRLVLPYKLSLDSERGKRSAAEWALWYCVRQLRASLRQV